MIAARKGYRIRLIDHSIERAPLAAEVGGARPFFLPAIFQDELFCYNASMTTLLQKAFAQAQNLTPPDQDALAKLILDEMQSDAKWEAVLAKSPEKVAKLGDKAWAEHEAGLTQPLDPNQL